MISHAKNLGVAEAFHNSEISRYAFNHYIDGINTIECSS